MAATEARPVDTVLVTGGGKHPVGSMDALLLESVEFLAQGARRAASVCTGAFVLAELGWLDGRRATTH